MPTVQDKPFEQHGPRLADTTIGDQEKRTPVLSISTMLEQLSKECAAGFESLGPHFFSRISQEQEDVRSDGIYDKYHIYLSATGLAYLDDRSLDDHSLDDHSLDDHSLDDHSLEAHQLTKVGSATVSIIKTSFPDSENVYRSCKIEQLEVETGNVLTKMQAFTTMLCRIQSFCVQHNAEYLAMAHILGSCWFSGLLEPVGFKLCDCKRVEEQGSHFCMVLPTPPTESPVRAKEEPSRQNTIDRTMATMDAESGVNAVASEKGKDTMSMVAPGSGVAQQLKAMEVDSSNSEAAGQSANKPTTPDSTTVQGLIDEIREKATASRQIPMRSRPAAKIANQKEYCAYWIRRGECDYMQSGCKYKHEMPIDEAALQKCGFREVPRWFKDSPGYEEYSQKSEELAMRRVAGVNAEEKVTSTAESSRQSSGRRGESMVSLQAAGRALRTPARRPNARQLGLHRSAANTNTTNGAAVRQSERQTYKPLGPPPFSNGFGIRGAAGGSSKVKEEKRPKSQAKNNGGSSISAGSPFLRQFQQALGGSRSAGNSAGSTMGAGSKRQLSNPVPDTDDRRARRWGKKIKVEKD